MKIYIGHSREFNYEAELYRVIRADSELSSYNIILPHEDGKSFNWGREFYSSLSLFIAEVSLPATGLGIELGWAYDSNVPIVCLSRRGAKVSSSLRAVTTQFYEYDSPDDLRKIIKDAILNLEK